MYELKTEHCFDSAHFLRGYQGKCANLHGHRWRVEAVVAAHSLQQEGQLRGMVVDFSSLKQDVRAMADEMDHALLMETGSLRAQTLQCLHAEGFRIIELAFRPTAENFARYFYDQLKAKGYTVRRVLVYETPTNCACYEEDETI